MADRPDYIAANREAWNEVAPRHGARNQARLIEQFRAGGCNLLEDEARAMVLETGIAGKSVVQVCCNNGKDLLSVKGMGAGRCLGIDLSDAFLAQARELAEAAGFTDDVHFLEADVYALPVELAGSFDVALTTIGVLTWMPDLPGFFGAVAGLLKPGGWWVMEETHPVVFMYEEDPDGGIPQLTYSYFRGGAERWDDGLDYFSGETYAASPSYSFSHKLSDILNAGIGAGLELRRMDEVGHDISCHCAALERAEANPPQGMYLLWRKP